MRQIRDYLNFPTQLTVNKSIAQVKYARWNNHKAVLANGKEVTGDCTQNLPNYCSTADNHYANINIHSMHELIPVTKRIACSMHHRVNNTCRYGMHHEQLPFQTCTYARTSLVSGATPFPFISYARAHCRSTPFPYILYCRKCYSHIVHA